ncbi:MAG: hypothetical protein HOQ45_10735 [Nocardioidaceae bacterium]|nr:hypothetical protein [Nocardioidaceae bacterium]
MSTTDLPLAHFSDVVVDQAHGHVFVSSGPAGNTVVVTDLDGVVQRELGPLGGPSGMTLSEDGSSLYVALAGGDGIEQVDTADLSMRKIGTGAGTCPRTVATVGERVWFGYGCDGQFGNLGAVDPRTRVSTLGVGGGLFHDAPLLVSSPRRPGLLVAGLTGQSPSRIYLLRVSTSGEPTATADHSRQVGGNLRSVAFSPDGRDLVVADGGVYHHQVFSSVDLSSTGTYPSSNYPNAVAVRSDGVVAAGIDGTYNPDVYLYEPERPAATRIYELTTSLNRTLLADGLAFGASRLYAVTSDSDDVFRLEVLDPPAPTTLSVRPDRSVHFAGTDASVTAHLGSDTTNRDVTVYSTVDGVRRELATGTVDDAGDLTVPVPDVTSSTTFTAVSTGDVTHASRAESATMRVRADLATRFLGRHARSGRYQLFRAGEPVVTEASLSPVQPNRCVSFRTQRWARGAWRPLTVSACRAVGADGRVSKPTTSASAAGSLLRVRAEFAGDDLNAARTSDWLYARHTR